MVQCSNCKFQNMPGTTHCGRCGASLMLATASINVYPPRATRWAKTWRKTTCWQIWNSVRIPVANLARQLDFNSIPSLPRITTVLQLLVPGWPQFATSKRVLGRVLLGTYLFFCILIVVRYGSLSGSLCIAVAITVHAISLYDFAHSISQNRAIRLSRFLLACGVSGLCLYLPLFRFVPEFAAPFVIQLNRPPLRTSDVLLVNTRAYRSTPPQVGDVVLYELNPVRAAGVVENGRNAVINFVGQRIDRILAGPGQSVAWNREGLKVDGQPATFLPLNPTNSPLSLSLTVPANHYFIIPSGDRIDTVTPDIEHFATRLSIVDAANIQGRVYWRNLPWSRMGSIR